MSVTDDTITGKVHTYQPDDAIPTTRKEYEFKNCVCVFFMTSPVNGQFIRRYTHVDYFENLKQEQVRDLDHRGASPWGCYVIYTNKERGLEIVSDINANEAVFY